ncbi:hypothetical protein HMPREF9078_02254 [Capnocytophaga sp. oral taxon 380 str. F0488]|nr:hypothetical protein HMPREF9078_02254 [Capnocytophaga sp. oral taxon 380 str. F0488]
MPKFQTLAKFVYINEQKTVRTARADREKTKEGWGYVEVKRGIKLR